MKEIILMPKRNESKIQFYDNGDIAFYDLDGDIVIFSQAEIKRLREVLNEELG